jgi:hypothetical protein
MQPNLYVSSDDLTLDPPSPVNNRTAVHVTVPVFNQGFGTARNVTVDWFLGAPFAGGTPIGWRNVLEIIPAGRSALAWINWVADVPGVHDLYAVVDINNSINETTKTDNIAHVPVIVISSPFGGVDLVVVKVKVVDSLGQEATQLPAKERASVQVLIDNVESKNATRVHLDVFIDVEDPAGLISSYEGQIGAHQPVWWSVPWTVAGSEGNHTITAKVLAIGQDEATFLDNVRSIRFTIGPRSTPPPETLLVSMYPDTSLPAPGSRLTVSGKVTKMSNGVDVPDATVTISFGGTTLLNTTTTNLLGRYVVSITVPARVKTYRLKVDVVQGYNTGSTFVTVDVQSPVVPPVQNGTKPGNGILSTNFIIIVVVLVVVVAPVSFLALRAFQERRTRIKKVHEEVLEIVEEKK